MALKAHSEDLTLRPEIELAYALAREIMEKPRGLGSNARWLLLLDGTCAAGDVLSPVARRRSA